MSLTDPAKLKALLDFESEEERNEFRADRIQLDILNEVSQRMEQLGVSRSELASRLKVSKSFVSQLFAVEKPLNLRTLAKLECALEARFRIDFSGREHSR